MAVVQPFAALRYDEEKVEGLAKVVTQPFDKITPEMQQEYLRRSPYNYVRLVKGESRPSDTPIGQTPAENVYTRAAEWLAEWRKQQVLIRRARPAFYAYHQTFTLPGTLPGAVAKTKITRKGFLGLGRVEAYENKIIFPHEKTHSAAKADRLELLRATRTHLESIFLLYSDTERKIESLLAGRTAQSPTVSVVDEYGVENSLWDVDEPEIVRAIEQAMAEKQLIIADGHHRYQTALNFERECRESRHPAKETDCAFALMTFVNMEGEGIVILPTHRLVAGLQEWNSAAFLKSAKRYFTIAEFPFSGDGERRHAEEKMQRAMSTSAGTAIGAIFKSNTQNGNRFYTLTGRDALTSDLALADLTPAERSLDVNILDRIVFGKCLSLDDAAIRSEKHLSYVRHLDEGIDSVVRGAAQACFFLNPVKIGQVRDIAFAGRVLPQKSTDFYPKLLSGLVLYPLEH